MRNKKFTNSPNVGDAPQAISESSADIKIEVAEHPMLVICQPAKYDLNLKFEVYISEN